ncbi:hypothetical protein BRARA_B03370 [Brassica rapa]|uniref:Pentacotripeptide-repeat region of PRORP domain-containing protein n=1 Tax=Brassica campestris TaxID=3711 RepID=A0A398AF46_BRACM|nr:hypothetical protein BRARA_B03370 [Brassica rapa]
MKLKRRRLVYVSVKIESLSLGTTRMCFSKVSSEPDRVETMALECGLKERENEMSFLDGVELEKPEGRVEPDVSLYNAVIHGMCLIREFKFAKELYVEMREMRLEPDGKTRAMMLQNLKRL